MPSIIVPLFYDNVKVVQKLYQLPFHLLQKQKSAKLPAGNIQDLANPFSFSSWQNPKKPARRRRLIPC